MTRPVRPVALVILTACMVYPGVTMLFQGLYPLFTGEYFNLVGEAGLWTTFFGSMGLDPMVVNGFKALLGFVWMAGVLGLWAGDGKAYPVAFAAAVLTLPYLGGGTVMAILAIVCLLFFRENAEEVPA